ncbi:hypothetical protein VTP21DRAFT_9679 [Calcarisporiella thermophila]
MSVHSGALTSRSVHPASPVLLTKNGPLEALIRCPGCFNPKASNHSLYLIKLMQASAILRETSAGTSY